MILTRVFAKCKTWRCKAEISLDETPGFYFYGHQLRYDAPDFRATCEKCGKTHSYKLEHVIVRRDADAVQ